MKAVLLKLGIGILSVALGIGIWMGLAIFLFDSPVSYLQALGFYLSYLTITGWFFFGLLSIALYHTLSRFFPAVIDGRVSEERCQEPFNKGKGS